MIRRPLLQTRWQARIAEYALHKKESDRSRESSGPAQRCLRSDIKDMTLTLSHQIYLDVVNFWLPNERDEF
ncbi:unnamed protein product [Mycena citricolor]|uniref:Uncharacterized protein n=1 Tax=Mycena citricolor TaxID=2018698 RepID=A0AAD2HN81_9AGAR|nr:unnamed protein product [Mycena citricolor]